MHLSLQIQVKGGDISRAPDTQVSSSVVPLTNSSSTTKSSIKTDLHADIQQIQLFEQDLLQDLRYKLAYTIPETYRRSLVRLIPAMQFRCD